MSTMTPAQALDRLRRMAGCGDLARLCDQYGVALLVAFGSAVRIDRAEAARDLDVAVSWTQDSRRDLFGLVGALVGAVGFDAIDVMEVDRAGPVAVEQALVGTVPLYEADAGLLAALRDRAIMRRMDTEWLRRLDLELMASR